MIDLMLKFAGVALLVVLSVAIHGAGTMPMMGRQVRPRPVVAHPAGSLLMHLAVALLVLELLLVHVAQIVVWGLYFHALGVFDDLQMALYFTAVTYTTLGYGDVVAGPAWVLEAGALAITGWLMFGWSTGVLVWILGRHYERVFPRDPNRRAPAGT
jgi:hypothetical protein